MTMTPESPAVIALRTELDAQIASLKSHLEKRLMDMGAQIRSDLIELIASQVEGDELTEAQEQFRAEALDRLGERSVARNKAMNTPATWPNLDPDKNDKEQTDGS